MKNLVFGLILALSITSWSQKELDLKTCRTNDGNCLKKITDEVNNFNQNIFSEKVKKCEPFSSKFYLMGNHVQTKVIVGKKDKACKLQLKDPKNPVYQECEISDKDMKLLTSNSSSEIGTDPNKFNQVCKPVVDQSHPQAKEYEKSQQEFQKASELEMTKQIQDFEKLSKKEQEKEIKEMQSSADELKKECEKKDQISCEIRENTKKMSEETCKKYPKSPVCKTKW